MNLKKCREQLGFTQADAANYLGVPKSTYVKWEMEQSAPSGEVLDILLDQMQSLLAAGAGKLYPNGQLDKNTPMTQLFVYADRVGYKVRNQTDYLTKREYESTLYEPGQTVFEFMQKNRADKVWIAHFKMGGEEHG